MKMIFTLLSLLIISVSASAKDLVCRMDYISFNFRLKEMSVPNRKQGFLNGDNLPVICAQPLEKLTDDKKYERVWTCPFPNGAVIIAKNLETQNLTAVISNDSGKVVPFLVPCRDEL